MTFRQLRYFLEVARTLSFSKAAEALFVSQSTLSKAIASLEEELGAVLFLRDHHSVSLTPAGAVLATNLPRLKDDLDKTIDLVQEVREGMRGRLALGVQSGFALPDVIVSAVEYCRHSMPFLSLTSECLDEAGLAGSLANGRIDFALGYLLAEEAAAPAGPRAARLLLEEQPVVVCVARSSRLPDEPGPRELARLRYAFDAPGSAPCVRRWQDYCRNQGFHAEVGQVAGVEAVALQVELGMAAAVVPAGHAIARSAGVRVLPVPDAYRVASALTWNPGNLNQIVPVFAQLVEADL